MSQQADSTQAEQHSVLNSSFPVLLPADKALFLPEGEWQALLRQIIARPSAVQPQDGQVPVHDEDNLMDIDEGAPKAPFLEGLKKHAARLETEKSLTTKNKQLTENNDVTHISSDNFLADLFYDLKESLNGSYLTGVLEGAWKEDPLLTLKIIFNARSIHLGKADRIGAYKAFGWLAENHPLTLLTNLKWLVRPVIAKRAGKEGDEAKPEAEGEEDFTMLDVNDDNHNKDFDVQYGVSHGYWKDLLNLVVFAAKDQLSAHGDPASLLHVKIDNSGKARRKRNWDPKTAKETRQLKKKLQNERVQQKLTEQPFYRALHFTVARLFADQLRKDKVLLDSGEKSKLRGLSLAAKWAPTHSEFHDKHTFILSTIAEILYPDMSAHSPEPDNRELYLRHVREKYRKEYSSPLRKALSVVEREVAAQTFENIKYEYVPSLAMDRYSKLFIEKDHDRFKYYVGKVAQGTAKISGATLLPSTLVSKAFGIGVTSSKNNKDLKAMRAAAEHNIAADVIDGQWKTLVKRIKDAGTLQSSLAVCDVSGSMSHPRFKDGSCPMHSAIGLSLLISEVTASPFGGGFISFTDTPTYISLDEYASAGLVATVNYIKSTPWEMNTNFVAVFEDVILPMAIDNKLSQEDMVKQIFVFSDMQFDEAQRDADRWTTSYERIRKKYAAAGYEVPRLIFWNLANRRNSKPVTIDDVDTALVSGYSQGMLRAFLETGTFDDVMGLEDEEEIMDEGEDGMVQIKKVKKKLDPLTAVKMAVQHQAYAMLEVLD